MRILHLDGTPAAMGEAFGESCRTDIAALYALRVGNALEQARLYGGRDADEATLLALARECLAPTEAYHPDGYGELCGIARGAGLAPEQVLALNGLTDLRDALAWWGDTDPPEGCTACIVQRDASAGGQLLCAQTWDLATDNAPFVVGVHRRPTGGPETWCVTTVGCLSLMGLNAHGLAVGTTNLRTRDARPGVVYLSLIHRALSCARHAEAVDAITTAPRAGGHFFYVADAAGRAAAIECSAARAQVLRVERGTYVQTNHCVEPVLVALEGDTPQASSRARRRRMEELLAKRAEGPGHDVESLKRCLSDRAGGPLAICRHDSDGISTNAAIVISPEEPAAWGCRGLPCEAPWVDLLHDR